MESPIQTNSKPDPLFSYWLAQFEFVKEKQSVNAVKYAR
jgi:hypothetical protein